jgi:hypothetical protein
MPVSLTIPADPASIRLARLVVSGYAAQAGATVDEIDDLRTVVDELCSMLVAHATSVDDLTLRLSSDGRALHAFVSGPARESWMPDELAEGIVKVLADIYEVRVGDGQVELIVEKQLELVGT